MDWNAREVGLRIGAHRGDPEFAPENTPAAFDAAVALGVDYVETDVVRTADGVLVLLHDDDLDRTTNGSGPVAQASSEEVLALDAGSWFDPKFADQRIITAGAFLDWVEAHEGLGGEIDIKAEGIGGELAALIQRSPVRDRMSLCSSIASELAAAKDAWADIPCFLILEDRNRDPVEAIQACRADGGDMPTEWLDETLVGRMRELGLAIMASTASDEPTLREIVRRGCDFVDSDRARIALDVRRELAATR
jgi:glycerophosphoryl diester phosphodiesterase